MQTKKSEEVLAEVHRNCRLALQSISDILPETEDGDVREELMRQHESYERLCGKAAILAKDRCVELKNPMSAGHIAKIVEICGNVYDLRRVVFISFCFENLVEVRKIKEDQTVQFLCDKYGADLLERLKRHKFDLDIYYRALTREAVSELHAAGVKVNCWTCDDKKDAEELISWGVDYITSNILE